MSRPVRLVADQGRAGHPVELFLPCLAPCGIGGEFAGGDGRGVMTDFHVAALNLRASLHEKGGDQAASDRALKSAIEERPTSRTYRQRGRSLLIRERAEETLQDAREAVRLDPADGETQYLLGLYPVGSHHFAEALDAFDGAIAAHGRISVSWNQIGVDHLMCAKSLHGLGRTDDAVASATRAVLVGPERRPRSRRPCASVGICTPRTPLRMRACEAPRSKPDCAPA